MLPVATAEIPGLQEACCLRRSVQRVGPARILDRLRPTNSSYGEICLRLDELEKLETNEECRQKVAEKRVGSVNRQIWEGPWWIALSWTAVPISVASRKALSTQPRTLSTCWNLEASRPAQSSAQRWSCRFEKNLHRMPCCHA